MDEEIKALDVDRQQQLSKIMALEKRVNELMKVEQTVLAYKDECEELKSNVNELLTEKMMLEKKYSLSMLDIEELKECQAETMK
jgi:archaellum component FlaC